jgi:hypothetical protein
MSHAAVQKVDVDLSVDARIIHDLSFPPGDSVNDNTEPDHEIEVGYDGPEALGNRIMDVASAFPMLQQMLTGDVKLSATFRCQLSMLGALPRRYRNLVS